MIKCKHCKSQIKTNITGIKSFCSNACKMAYRKAYQAIWITQKRLVDSGGGYVGIKTRLVDSANPRLSTICKGEKCSPRLSSNQYEKFGGLKWYQLVKNHCCNFDVKQNEGYCMTLAEPYSTFRAKCSDCSYLGQSLATKHMS